MDGCKGGHSDESSSINSPIPLVEISKALPQTVCWAKRPVRICAPRFRKTIKPPCASDSRTQAAWAVDKIFLAEMAARCVLERGARPAPQLAQGVLGFGLSSYGRSPRELRAIARHQEFPLGHIDQSCARGIALRKIEPRRKEFHLGKRLAKKIRTRLCDGTKERIFAASRLRHADHVRHENQPDILPDEVEHSAVGDLRSERHSAVARV